MAKKLKLKKKIRKVSKKKALSGIEKARATMKAIKDSGGEVKREFNLMVRAINSPKSKIKAIHAQCFNCMGGTVDDMPDSGWKKLVGTCTSISCPLYNFRPYQPKD